jgi:hypothetical protein
MLDMNIAHAEQLTALEGVIATCEIDMLHSLQSLGAKGITMAISKSDWKGESIQICTPRIVVSRADKFISKSSFNQAIHTVIEDSPLYLSIHQQLR